MAVGLRKDITLKTTHQFLSALFSEDIHAKRVYSLANSTLGVISSASLVVNSIGQELACGSKGEILGASRCFRFAPDSRHCATQPACPFRAVMQISA
jgi:hypothetical protein